MLQGRPACGQLFKVAYASATAVTLLKYTTFVTHFDTPAQLKDCACYLSLYQDVPAVTAAVWAATAAGFTCV